MFRISLALLLASSLRAQTTPPDTPALQALVAEIRQLRLDMQAATIATQRVQISLYRLQTQGALVTRATSRLDDARSALANLQSEKKSLADRIQQVEESLKLDQSPADRKNQETMAAQMKAAVERMTAEETRLQAREIDAETQFRAEQARLAGLQDQLERLDQLLDSLTRK